MKNLKLSFINLFMGQDNPIRKIALSFLAFLMLFISFLSYGYFQELKNAHKADQICDVIVSDVDRFLSEGITLSENSIISKEVMNREEVVNVLIEYYMENYNVDISSLSSIYFSDDLSYEHGVIVLENKVSEINIEELKTLPGVTEVSKNPLAERHAELKVQYELFGYIVSCLFAFIAFAMILVAIQTRSVLSNSLKRNQNLLALILSCTLFIVAFALFGDDLRILLHSFSKTELNSIETLTKIITKSAIYATPTVLFVSFVLSEIFIAKDKRATISAQKRGASSVE